jgi:hypothetical protein
MHSVQGSQCRAPPRLLPTLTVSFTVHSPGTRDSVATRPLALRVSRDLAPPPALWRVATHSYETRVVPHIGIELRASRDTAAVPFGPAATDPGRTSTAVGLMRLRKALAAAVSAPLLLALPPAAASAAARLRPLLVEALLLPVALLMPVAMLLPEVLLLPAPDLLPPALVKAMPLAKPPALWYVALAPATGAAAACLWRLRGGAGGGAAAIPWFALRGSRVRVQGCVSRCARCASAGAAPAAGAGATAQFRACLWSL